jgi:predicted DNA-binding protein (MmcQ/YjbR family)
MVPGRGAGEQARTRLTEICLALPTATAEGEQHVAFRVRGRTFAYYLHDHHGDGRLAPTKVPLGDMEALVSVGSRRFFVPGYLGGRGWIGVRLDIADVDWNEIAGFVRVSYRLVAPKRLASLV